VKRLVPTGEMTTGPFFPCEFAAGANDLTVLDGQQVEGEKIEIRGRVVQGDGKPLDNLVLEIWQADPSGRYDSPDFLGWGRAATDASGIYVFRTVKPGSAEGRSAHINFLVLSSGLMRQLQTVMFFEESGDPVFLSVEKSVRHRLVAKRQGANRYVFDIRLRGGEETPFFDD
jgi:protocatechuate 3,4-dioxygenase alpha subunit